MKKCFYLLTILALLLQPGLTSMRSASAQVGGDEPQSPDDVTLFVKPVATGTGNCDSWANACGLQAALTAAEAGDEIWVAAGTYKPTAGAQPRLATFDLRHGVAIYGGFAGTEASREQRDWETNVTTLSGDIGVAGNNSDNSYHVVFGNGVIGAILDGFTITLGNANAASYPYDRGGGMFNFYSSPALANVTFSGNTATNGGGMFNENSSLALANVTFSGNTALYGGGMYNDNSSPALANVTSSGNTALYGGGMYNENSSPALENVTFSGNTATNGGGMYNLNNSSPALANVTFSGNTASNEGGGMYNFNNSSPALENVTFSGNTATNNGGGMFNSSSHPTLANVTFSGNKALYGGGMYNYFYSSPALANVTFSGNTAGWYGGGMFNASSSPALANVTFSGNTAGSTGGGMYNYFYSSPALANAILWGNTPAQNQIYNDGSTSVVTYSDIQGGYTGEGNINADPLFVRCPSPGGDGTWGTSDDDYGDLRLQLASPAIDAGNNTAVPTGITTDRLGFPRFVDIASVLDTGSGTPPIVDMGAYEAQSAIYLPLVRR